MSNYLSDESIKALTDMLVKLSPVVATSLIGGVAFIILVYQCMKATNSSQTISGTKIEKNAKVAQHLGGDHSFWSKTNQEIKNSTLGEETKILQTSNNK